MLAHRLRRWLNLTHSHIAALDASLRLSGGFHVIGRLDIFSFVTKASYVALNCSSVTIADIFTSLRLTEVVSCNRDSSTIINTGVRQKKVGTVVTAGVVGRMIYLTEVWLQCFQSF